MAKSLICIFPIYGLHTARENYSRRASVRESEMGFNGVVTFLLENSCKWT